MHLNKSFLGLFACAWLCACSNDEPVNTPEVQPVFTGDEAYITVRLADAGSIQSRAVTGNPDYEYGNADEHSVTNAYFYFYDANGVFVAQGSAWDSGTPSTTKPDGNIEFKSNNVVVLKGLTKKNYPKYMVTVLNRPAEWASSEPEAKDFTYGTLDELEKALTSRIKDNSGNFVMSTTSWSRTTGERYFVNEVQESNFSLEPIDDAANSTNYVTVYVERLAAKVTLDVSESLPSETIGGRKYYKIKASVAGEGNQGGNIAAEDLYVDLLGWKLNATARKSYVVKNIDGNWTGLGFTWNKPDDFRSFWGKSFNYGKDGYPSHASEASGCEYLEYVSLDKDLNAIGNSAYCAENTNTADIVAANFPSAVTSILLKARICDKGGNPLDLVRFNGLLFRKDSFCEYILNVMKAKGLLNVWTETTPAGSTNKTYKQLGTENVSLENNGDGAVYVKLNDGLALYSRSDEEYTPLTAGQLSDLAANLETESGDAIGYNGGLMYYNIPIEHLNESNKTNGVYDGIREANYGVVRNHHYYVTVNKLEKIGKGIYEPDEVIVPGSGDDDKDAYYVGATINILSWKIVDQSVEL